MPAQPAAILRKDGSTVDLAGVTYIQRRRDADHPCGGCVAHTRDMRLCDTLCSYCHDGYVFQVK